MTVITSMETKLDNATVQNLLDYTEFTTSLVEKLQNSFVKLDGTNANDAVVTTMLGKLQDPNKVVKATELDAKNFATTTKLTEETAKLANKDGSNINVDAFSTHLASNFAKLDGTNVTDTVVTAMLGKLQDSNKVVTISKLTEETGKLANKDGSDIDIGPISTKLADNFAKLDGTNVTDTVVTAMLGKLQDSNKVVTISKLTEETAKLANKDGSNINVDAFSTHLASNFAKLDGSNINVVPFSTKLTTEGTSTIKTELDKFAKLDGSNINVGEFSTKLASNFAKLDGTNAKQGAQLLREMLSMKADDSAQKTILEERLAVAKTGTIDVDQFVRIDGTNINANDFANKLSDNFVKLDGTNVTDTVVTTMLGKLQDSNKVVKATELDAKNFATTTKLTEETAKLANKDGSNIADGFSDALKSKFVLVDGSNIEQSELETKLAGKFAAISSTSGGKTAADIDPADTLPDSWANLI